MAQFTLKPPLPLRSPLRRPPRRSVINSTRRQHIPDNRAVALPIRTLRRPIGQIPTPTHLALARGNIKALYGALEDLERGQRLVERHFVPALVDAREGKGGRLFYLAVHGGVAGGDVGVAGRGEARGVYLVGDDLAAEPVAAEGWSVVCLGGKGGGYL